MKNLSDLLQKEDIELRVNKNFASLVKVYQRKTKNAIPLEKLCRNVSRLDLIPTNDYLDKLDKITSSMDDFVLPQYCRYFYKRNNRILVVLEIPPRIYSIKSRATQYNSLINNLPRNSKFLKEIKNFDKRRIKEDGIDDTEYTFDLSMPYVIFFLWFDFRSSLILRQAQLFFRLVPLKSLEDKLIIPPLPNLGSDNVICFGTISGHFTASNLNDLNSLCQFIVNSYFNAPFNNDLTQNVRFYQDSPYLKDFVLWNYHTKKDPLFIYKVKWILSDKTLRHWQRKYSDLAYTDMDNKSLKSIGLMEKMIEAFSVVETNCEKIYTDEYYFDNKYPISTGQIFYDENGKSLYLREIYSEGRDKQKVYLCFLDSDGHKQIFVLPDHKERLALIITRKQIVDHFYLGEEKICVGDALLFQCGEGIIFHHKVKNILKNIDGKIEVEIGNLGCFLSESLDPKTIRKLDLNKVAIQKGDKEFYITPESMFVIFDRSFEYMTFIKVNKIVLDDSPIINDLLVNYKNHRGETITAKLKEFSTSLIEEFNYEKLRILERVYIVNSYLIVSEGNGLDYIYDEKYFICSNKKLTADLKGRVDLIKNTIFDEEKKEIKISRKYGPCLNFRVGDEVIIVDNKNVESMLNKIYEIIDISFNENSDLILKLKYEDICIDFKLLDLNKNVLNSYIIRKVCRKIDDYEVGTKIVLKQGVRNKYFSRKYIYEIKSFIIDSPYEQPIVLLNNGLTILFSDLKDRFVVLNSTRRKINLAPIVTVVPITSGDIIQEKWLGLTKRLYLAYRIRKVFKPYMDKPVEKAMLVGLYENGSHEYYEKIKVKYILRDDGLLSLPQPILFNEPQYIEGRRIDVGFVPTKGSGYFYIWPSERKENENV